MANKMKDSIVLDTNVLVSALLTKNRAVSAPFQILSRVLSGQIVMLVNNAIENEYREVLLRAKFHFDPVLIEKLLSAMANMWLKVEVPENNVTLPDMKDKPFYDLAVSFQHIGVKLVTGNIKHFPDCAFAVMPADYLQLS